MSRLQLRSICLAIGIALLAGLSPVALAEELVVYSGRSKSLVEPILDQFQRETGIEVKARFGSTSELVLAVQEEGDRSPADVFWAQDAGALGKLADSGILTALPSDLISAVPAKFRDSGSTWVATSGRARVLAYSSERVAADDLPGNVFELTDAKWKGRVGWAPTNGSFQAFVTAMRETHGDEKTRAWLTGMKANGAKAYPKNTPIIEALAAGEIDLGIPNHYYLLRFKTADKNFPVEQTFFDAGDVGNMLNTAGVAILATSERVEAARKLVAYLLSPTAQQYFTSQVFEYPVREGAIPNTRLVSLDELRTVVPAINLNALDDLDGTLRMLTEVGLL